MKRFIFLLCLISPALNAQNLYLSSGATFNSTHLSVYNIKTDDYDEFRTNKIAIDYINILAEFEISGKVSFKAGYYYHPEYFIFEVYQFELGFGTAYPYYSIYPQEVLSRNIDFPFLVSLRSDHSSGFSLNFDAGLYLGFALFSSHPIGHIGFKQYDVGTTISLGAGSNKWRVSSYLLLGLVNMWDTKSSILGIDEGEKANCISIGLNLSRKISLKKNSNQ